MLRVITVVFCAVFGVVSCGGNSDSGDNSPLLSLSTNTVIVSEGESVNIQSSVIGLDNPTYSANSNNQAVASVVTNDEGTIVVTGITTGTATIRIVASAPDGVSDSAMLSVTVTSPLSAITGIWDVSSLDTLLGDPVYVAIRSDGSAHIYGFLLEENCYQTFIDEGLLELQSDGGFLVKPGRSSSAGTLFLSSSSLYVNGNTVRQYNNMYEENVGFWNLNPQIQEVQLQQNVCANNMPFNGNPGDTNRNGIPDGAEVVNTGGEDSNSNGVDDRLDSSITGGPDSNSNSVDDAFEVSITAGTDFNEDGLDDDALLAAGIIL